MRRTRSTKLAVAGFCLLMSEQCWQQPGSSAWHVISPVLWHGFARAVRVSVYGKPRVQLLRPAHSSTLVAEKDFAGFSTVGVGVFVIRTQSILGFRLQSVVLRCIQ
jgi:hypothetical protein